MNKSINQPINQSINQSNNQPTKQINKQTKPTRVTNDNVTNCPPCLFPTNKFDSGEIAPLKGWIPRCIFSKIARSL